MSRSAVPAAVAGRPAIAPLIFDWARHAVSAKPQPCRICGAGAFMTDADGQPCHKVCAEAAATRRGGAR